MNNIKRHINSLIIVLAGFMLWGCSEQELSLPGDLGGEISEGMAQIKLLIPDNLTGSASFGSRAFDIKEEGLMSNLYVIAIQYNDVEDAQGEPTGETMSGKVYTFPLNPIGENFQLDKDGKVKDYHLFSIGLYPGKYKFCVVSNIDLYLNQGMRITDFSAESDLTDLVLNFDRQTPLVPTQLPMACLPEDIRYTTINGIDDNGYPQRSEMQTVKDVTNNLVEITKENGVELWVDMTFLCSKVRYTILFDKTPGGISEAFGKSWIRFNVENGERATVTNIRRQTKLWPETSTGGTNATGNPNFDETNQFIPGGGGSDSFGTWTLGIDRYNWHIVEGANYPLAANSELTPYEGQTSAWVDEPRKVWQGIVYLPENLGGKCVIDGIEKENVKTVLRFPYYTKANSLDDTPELAAPSPKEIKLFGNDGEELYESSGNSGKYDKTDPSATFNGIERGVMYDVVAKVVTADVDDMTIQVYVSILPWHDIDQSIPDEGDLFNPRD